MNDKIYAKTVEYKGIEAVELSYNGYYALVAPTIGSNVLRFRDNDKNMEIFRFSAEVPISAIVNSSAIWGLPTLYLANRFDRGIIKTSDAVYRLPENEAALRNHLHGFIHNRVHKIKEIYADESKTYVTTMFTYDEDDYFFNCFPIRFTMEITIELSKDGLRHTVVMKNESEKMMPISIATHTAINAPFVDGGKHEDILLELPIEQKIAFNKERWLPTGTTEPLDSWDMEYKNGTKRPVNQDINNNMYFAGNTTLNGEKFYGCIMTDTASGKKICNEIDEKYKFWIVWNEGGFNNYFCTEPMTAQINAPNLDLPPEKSGYAEISPNETYTVSQRFFTL